MSRPPDRKRAGARRTRQGASRPAFATRSADQPFGPNVRHAARLEQSVVTYVERLAALSQSIVKGHVVIEPAEPHRDTRHHVRIHLTLPGAEILVSGEVIRDVFTLADRQLRAYERRRGHGRTGAPRLRRGAAPVRTSGRV